MKVLLALLAVLGACEHNIHVRIGQTEAITVAGGHD